MRVIARTIVLLMALLGAASAQLPKGNVFIGYSFLSQDTNTTVRANLNGWNGSLEGKVLPFLGIVADFGGHYGTWPASACPAGVLPPCPQLEDKLYSALFGPRASFSIGRLRPFAHVLIGVAHQSLSASGSSVTDNSFATAAGGGVDFRLVPLVAWRFQADALHTHLFNAGQTDLRVSTGLVLRF